MYGVVKRGTVSGSTFTAQDWNAAQPVSGASIRFLEWQRETQTGSDGRFSLEGPIGPVTIIISSGTSSVRQSYPRPTEARILLASQRPKPLPPNVTLLRGIVWGGRFAGAAPTPAELSNLTKIANARVRVLEWNRETVTRPDGSFQLEGPTLPPQHRVTIEALANGYAKGGTQTTLQQGVLQRDLFLRRQ
jgi:hypothetical protein